MNVPLAPAAILLASLAFAVAGSVPSEAATVLHGTPGAIAGIADPWNRTAALSPAGHSQVTTAAAHSGAPSAARDGTAVGATAARYSPTITGSVQGYRLAGIEPDGDPLDQVVLQTRLSASAGLPAMNLIINSYLENFKPDTTPILPDLLNPKQTAQNLGGFLQGKALLTDDAGNTLFVGSFLAEAFINDNSNHAVMRLDGMGSASHGIALLKGIFYLRRDTTLHGSLAGSIRLPPAGKRFIEAHRGARMKPLTQIINLVRVKPAAMVGRATAKSRTVPLHTGYSRPASPTPPRAAGHASPVTIIAGIGAVVSLLLGVYLFWLERRGTKPAASR